MVFFRVYRRVIGLLRAEKWLAVALAIANVAVAALQFYEPVLFGQVIDLLTTAKDKPVDVLWHDARQILGLWALVGLGCRPTAWPTVGGWARWRATSSICSCCRSPSTTPSTPAA